MSAFYAKLTEHEGRLFISIPLHEGGEIEVEVFIANGVASATFPCYAMQLLHEDDYRRFAHELTERFDVVSTRFDFT